MRAALLARQASTAALLRHCAPLGRACASTVPQHLAVPALALASVTASGQHSKRRRAWSLAAWASLAAVVASTTTTCAALCDAEQTTPREQAHLYALHQWLSDNGADVVALDFERVAVCALSFGTLNCPKHSERALVHSRAVVRKEVTFTSR